MPTGRLALSCCALLDAATSTADLAGMMPGIATQLGFGYYAIALHADAAWAHCHTMRLDNFPTQWRRCYADDRPVCDPVRRASQVTHMGFTWSQLPELIRLTLAERDFLARLHAAGMGDAYTIPVSIPGQAIGSCTFGIALDRVLPSAVLPGAYVVGNAAFEAARRLHAPANAAIARPILTPRQRHCVLWAARGKSDWEISRILEISPETVTRHLKQARERYGVQKRTSLVIRALFDGSLSFADVLQH